MKKKLFFLTFTLYSAVVFSATSTITNSGFTFSPASITINIGDSVSFVLASIHNAVEVSQATWNANNTTPLPGGFSTAFSGGTVLPAALTLGTHYYVCAAHGSSGMKGIIIVQDPATQYTVSVSANPSSGGTVSSSGTHNAGTTVTVNATANAGYTFMNWTEGSTVVSSNSGYSFTAIGNRTLVANFSPVTGISNFQADTNSVAIYPNPTAGNFTIVLNDLKNTEIQVGIINAAGEEIVALQKEKVNGNYSKEISLASLNKGIYFVQVKTNKGTIIKKIVVSH